MAEEARTREPERRGPDLRWVRFAAIVLVLELVVLVAAGVALGTVGFGGGGFSVGGGGGISFGGGGGFAADPGSLLVTLGPVALVAGAAAVVVRRRGVEATLDDPAPVLGVVGALALAMVVALMAIPIVGDALIGLAIGVALGAAAVYLALRDGVEESTRRPVHMVWPFLAAALVLVVLGFALGRIQVQLGGVGGDVGLVVLVLLLILLVLALLVGVAAAVFKRVAPETYERLRTQVGQEVQKRLHRPGGGEEAAAEAEGGPSEAGDAPSDAEDGGEAGGAPDEEADDGTGDDEEE